MARHRSPEAAARTGPRHSRSSGAPGADGVRRGPVLPPVDLRAAAAQVARLAAVRVPVDPPAVPGAVLRGVALATVAAVGVTGAGVALAGTGVAAPQADAAGTTSVVPAPAVIAAAGRAALAVPAPVIAAPGFAAPAPSPVVSQPDPGVLDPSALRRAVDRAQADGRRLAERERRSDATKDAGAQAAEAEDQAEEKRAEEERTAERARRAGRAAEPEASPKAGTSCDLGTGELGAVKPHVRAAAEFLGCAFDEPTVLGVAGRGGNTSDHPRGRALDFMVDRATGDRLAACALRNREALGISYVIWRQRIDTGDGFRAMADRGGPTANHFDHVHVSFDPGAGSGDPTSC